MELQDKLTHDVNDHTAASEEDIINGRERYCIAKIFFLIVQAFQKKLVDNGIPKYSALENMLIFSKIMQGEIDRQPFTAHKLSLALDMPRSTVQRKLNQLVSIKMIFRSDRNHYRINRKLANEGGSYAPKIISQIKDQLSKMDTFMTRT